MKTLIFWGSISHIEKKHPKFNMNENFNIAFCKLNLAGSETVLLRLIIPSLYNTKIRSIAKAKHADCELYPILSQYNTILQTSI